MAKIQVDKEMKHSQFNYYNEGATAPKIVPPVQPNTGRIVTIPNNQRNQKTRTKKKFSIGLYFGSLAALALIAGAFLVAQDSQIAASNRVNNQIEEKIDTLDSQCRQMESDIYGRISIVEMDKKARNLNMGPPSEDQRNSLENPESNPFMQADVSESEFDDEDFQVLQPKSNQPVSSESTPADENAPESEQANSDDAASTETDKASSNSDDSETGENSSQKANIYPPQPKSTDLSFIPIE